MADAKNETPRNSETAFLKAVRDVHQQSGITMDSNNEEAMKIGETAGVERMVEHMTKGRTYSEMRSMFG
jgi:hypothetical protein